MISRNASIEKLNALAAYVKSLVSAIRRGEEAADFDDDGWEKWLASWEEYRASVANLSEEELDTLFTEIRLDGELAKWRGECNAWYSSARATGRLRTATDSGEDVNTITDTDTDEAPPDETPPDDEAPPDDETPPDEIEPIPGKSPPRKSPPKKRVPKDEATEPEANRKTPWIALMLIAAPIAFLVANRKRG